MVADDAEWYDRVPVNRARKVGRSALARLYRAEQQERQAAVDALPPAHLELPALTDSWTPWRLLENPWRNELGQLVFRRYRAAPDDAARDRVIRWAIGAGLSKASVHRGLGVARTTIDRVLEASS
ncbi:hypothetical protein ABZ883_36605 [Streptomyces sp. NPDC046977]|uniref:hypothetical protein n=1 Tax=Streptomyces sp. NPDC046977 TaxID=3154703 RepID=UPI0033C93B97